MNKVRLLQLIDLLVNGDITPDDHDLLQQTLKIDSNARNIFREQMDFEAGLRTWASESVDIAPSPAATAWSSLQSDKGALWSQRNVLVACAVAASIVLIGGLQIWSSFNKANHAKVAEGTITDRVDYEPATKFVGVIRQQHDCQWSVQPVSTLGRLAVGKLALSKGVAELSFDSGTDITMEAPCEIEVTSPDTARLLAGNVFVNVTELSNGFTLNTPESQIIDEGTEYAVSLGEESTEVHVFDGRVVWIPSIDGMEPQSDFEDRIEAGEAKSYSRSEPTKMKQIPFGKRQFVRRIEQQIRESAGGALLAYDGFENLAGHVRRGRSGFGWSDGWQSGGRGRGQLADIVETPDDTVFGLNRSGRRQMSLEQGRDVRRTFESPLSLPSGESIFVAVLLTRRSSQSHDEGQSLQISLEPDLPGRGRRLHQIASFGITTDGFPFINSGNAIMKTASPIAFDQTYLCVLRLAVTGQDINPSLRVYHPGEVVDDTEPSSWTVSGQPGTADYPPASLRIIVGEGVTWQIDELKVGTTWQAVTAAI